MPQSGPAPALERPAPDLPHPTAGRDQALAALQALANGTRLDLVRALIAAGDTGLPAGVLAGRLGLSNSRLSFHLAALEQAGVVEARRVSRNIFYSAGFARLGQTIGYLLHDCCAADPRVSACCAAAPVANPGGSPARDQSFGTEKT